MVAVWSVITSLEPAQRLMHTLLKVLRCLDSCPLRSPLEWARTQVYTVIRLSRTYIL